MKDIYVSLRARQYRYHLLGNLTSERADGLLHPKHACQNLKASNLALDAVDFIFVDRCCQSLSA